MYNKVDTNMNFVEREKKTEQFWRENNIFRKSMENRKEGETYTFYDGPPTANGKPHIGHVETRTIKDMIPRFQTMKGKYVPRKAGWDTHGLPVEIEVEKLLGLDGKDQIENYGLEPFIKKCKESVWKYKGMWEDWDKIDSDPGAVRAKAYDIVLNGTELGGGSVRIHQDDIQEKMFEVLGFTKERAHEQFGFLLDAFSYGVPPHAGLAFGVDRICMHMLHTDNIKEVIAFPKVKDASDLMSEAPGTVDPKQLEELGIAVAAEEDEE